MSTFKEMFTLFLRGSLNYLRSLDRQARLLVIWDGASYHRSHQLREFLATVNAGLPFEDWKIECIRFAPHAPEQNPVEDIWLLALPVHSQILHVVQILCHRQIFI